jgi:peptidoglycan/LPS O-acetylase OafA/YrhL
MRIKGLDVLRGVAILLVILRHGSIDNNPLKEFGWLGVDLFFVISGVLVSGIIFKEYQEQGSVNVKRFLIRRGFKIYPSFYFFVLFSVIFHWFRTDTFYDVKLILYEIFYLQNYFDGIWLHTWSLNVEEHFYIALAIVAFLTTKTKVLYRKDVVITSLLLLLVTSFLFRYQFSLLHKNENILFIMKTHLRADGLIIGILISYIHYFTNWYQRIIGKEIYFLIAGIILIFPGFCYPGGSFVMNTYGLTTVNIGFGLITLVAMHPLSVLPFLKKLMNIPTTVLSFIGKNSYSMYLWHLTALSTVDYIFNYSKPVNFSIYLIASILLGILMTYIIEKPFLRWRERVTK